MYSTRRIPGIFSSLYIGNREESSRNSTEWMLKNSSADGDADDPDIVEFMEKFESLPNFSYRELPLLFFPLGVVANIVLLVYLIRSRRYKSPTFAMITSLAICDLGSCTFTLTWVLFIFPLMRYANTDYLCKLCVYIQYTTFQASMFHVAAFSVMRYCMLVYPLKARVKITTIFVVKICAAIWLVIATYTLPIGILFGEEHYQYKGETVIICKFHGIVEVRQVTLVNLNLLLPALIVLFCQVLKQIRMVRAKKAHKTSQQERGSTDARAVMIVVCVVFCAGMPQFLHLMLHNLFGVPKLAVHHFVWVMCAYAIFVASVIDPFVYVFASPTVRKDIRKVLFSRKEKT